MKILITGGPTWVKIDEVRIITNIFTGKTALFLAKYFKKRGCKVTLVLNTQSIPKLPVNIRVIPFKYYQDLKNRLETELKKVKYNAIIHSAAISDYKLTKVFKGKISSEKRGLILKLVPTLKLIKMIRRLAKESFVVQFKLEINQSQLVDKAYHSLKKNSTDLVVANSLIDLKLGYRAFIIDRNKNIKEVNSKKSLAANLFNHIKSTA